MRILAAIFAFCLVGQSTFALNFEDLRGKWVGDRVSKNNKTGKTEIQPTVYIFKKTAFGLAEQATTTMASGILKSHGKYSYDKYNNVVYKTRGPASFFSTKNGTVVTVSDGYWRFRDDILRINLYAQNSGDRSTTQFHLLSRNLLLVVIHTSTGIITGRFVRQ